MRSTFRKIGPKAFTLKPLLSLFNYLLDQVPDEGTIFNLYSIETNLGLLSEFREFVMLIGNSISSLPETIQKTGWKTIGDWQLELAAVK